MTAYFGSGFGAGFDTGPPAIAPYPPASAAAELRVLPAILAAGIPIDLDEPLPGHQKGPGAYVPFVVVAFYDGTPIARTPIDATKLIVRCYGKTLGEAWGLWYACKPVFHDGRSRTSRGVGIWHSGVQSVTPDHDPQPPVGTGQPCIYAVVNYPTTPLVAS
jgi:hypothetical protein